MVTGMFAAAAIAKCHPLAKEQLPLLVPWDKDTSPFFCRFSSCIHLWSNFTLPQHPVISSTQASRPWETLAEHNGLVKVLWQPLVYRPLVTDVIITVDWG